MGVRVAVRVIVLVGVRVAVRVGVEVRVAVGVAVGRAGRFHCRKTTGRDSRAWAPRNHVGEGPGAFRGRGANVGVAVAAQPGAAVHVPDWVR